MPKSAGMTAASRKVGKSTFAIGDIHGEVTLLRHLMNTLPVELGDTLVFLGDYLDRGEDSAATFDELIGLAEAYHCIFLRGNHEDAWLAEWTGSSFTRQPTIGGARKAWKDFGGQPPFELGRWLEQTRIDFEDPYAYYVHAGVVPGQPFTRTPALQKLWGAGGFLETNYDWGKPVVFGHWHMPEPLLQPNKIGLDTHAFETGVLSAIRLPDRTVFQARR
jgi:serine/threonine protein phosphatase 1